MINRHWDTAKQKQMNLTGAVHYIVSPFLITAARRLPTGGGISSGAPFLILGTTLISTHLQVCRCHQHADRRAARLLLRGVSAT